MPADPERAAAIEGSVNRTLRFAAEELGQSPDRAASKLSQATTQLDSADAREHLSAETIARFRAQVADLQKQVDDAERAEFAGRIERDVRRVLRGLEDEIGSNGSQVESFLERATARLARDDVAKALTPETIATLRGELDALRARVGGSAAPPPPPPPPPPPRQAPSAAPERAAPTPPPASPAAPAAVLSEEAQRLANSITRTLRLVAGDIDAPGWRQIGGQIAQAATQLQSDQARQLLPASTLEAFRAQLAEFEAQFARNDRAEQAEQVEDFLRRLLRDAEDHIDWADRIGGMLAKVTEALESERTRTYLPADRAAFFRDEIARVAALAGGSERQRAIDDATGPLQDLEQRVTESIFDGLGEYETQKLWGELETLKDRVGYALDRLPADDATARELRSRLEAVVARRAAAYGATRHAAVLARVSAAWEATLAKVAGWEGETQDTSAAALGGPFMPQTREAVRILRDALSGSSLHSPIPDARAEYADDPTIAKIVADGERMVDAGIAKMTAAFDAILDAAEKIPTPTLDPELHKASFMAERAREAFEGTSDEQPRVQRARDLLATWDATLETVKVLTDAYYARLADEAAAAWPAIAAAVKAEEGFDPADSTWRGRAVRINGLYNRIRWDFTGNYHLAIWVNETPVAGDFEPHVLEAFIAGQDNTRSSIDDHSPWDAILVVGGPGKLKQRFKATVKKDGATIGEVEEWRPVDCVTCRVIALRAGPVAVGPR